MKLTKYIAAGLLASTAAGFTSCSEEFLDENYTTGYSTQFFETPEGIKSLTLSLYGSIRWLGGYESQGYYATMGGTDEFGIGTDMCNEMWCTYDIRMAPQWITLNGNTGTNTGIWDTVFYGIASCNKIIAGADVIEDEAERNNCLAQAYFYRGFSYYLLTSQFGHCVLQTEPVVGVVRNFKNTTPQECWEQVISDLKNAYELFDGEKNTTAGPGESWTKASAAHFLAKAYLFAASERNDSWNANYKQEYLEEALKAANYAIQARSLENDVTDLYCNWTGPDCDIEKSNELLMVIPQNESFNGRTQCRNAGAFFNPQFSNFSNALGGQRGCITGGKDFQRFRPTEYTLSVFDNVNDARLWKSFTTVYGTAVAYDGGDHTGKVELGDPSIVFIINKKSDTSFDKFTFGAPKYQTVEEDGVIKAFPNFVDEEGRLPKAGRVQPRYGETEFSGKPNQPIHESWILYKNGEFVGDKFGLQQDGTYGAHGANMFPGVSKHTCGYLSGFASDYGSRDIIIARLGETYLVRAEIKVRLNDYPGAKEDIDVLRKRGAWHDGENRSYYVDGCYEAAIKSSQLTNDTRLKANDGWNLGMNTYYLSNPGLEPTTASTEAAMINWTWDNLPAEDEAILAKLGVSSKFDRALNFILNEQTRELVGEFTRWEHLSRTKTLETRAVKLNPDVLNFDSSKHYVRPIPQAFLDQLQKEDGSNLSDDEKKAWQNPGY